MFKKKRKYSTRISRGDSFTLTGGTSKEVSSDDIMEVIQSMFKKEGRVVIDFIDDENISITSLKTIQSDNIEYKLDEIKDMIRKNVLK